MISDLSKTQVNVAKTPLDLRNCFDDLAEVVLEHSLKPVALGGA
jgi:hypothetical protein